MKRLALICLLLAAATPVAGRTSAATAFRCSGHGGIAAMENEYIEQGGSGACWGHLGHHTYALGGLYAVGEVTGGRVFTVEIQFSPPTEVMMTTPGAAPITVEASTDGSIWTTIHQIPYNLRGSTRQELFFSFDGGDIPARFLRIRQPRSAAQGLSGYLDSSSFDAELTPLLQPPVAVQPGPKTYSCADDIMERFIDAHPCWAGGINRYDAPSVFHTYAFPIELELEAITGHVTVLPWRSDDYYYDGGSATSVATHVQVSVDGIAWTHVGTVGGAYGRPIPIDLTGLDPLRASFVRLVAERHFGWNRHPALKHVRGFLVDSSLTIDAPIVA